MSIRQCHIQLARSAGLCWVCSSGNTCRARARGAPTCWSTANICCFACCCCWSAASTAASACSSAAFRCTAACALTGTHIKSVELQTHTTGKQCLHRDDGVATNPNGLVLNWLQYAGIYWGCTLTAGSETRCTCSSEGALLRQAPFGNTCSKLPCPASLSMPVARSSCGIRACCCSTAWNRLKHANGAQGLCYS